MLCHPFCLFRFAGTLLDKEDGCGYGNHRVGAYAHVIENGPIKEDVQNGIDQESNLQKIGIILEVENRKRVLEVGDYGK